MDLELGGHKCVILGGSRGIGRAIALGLAAEGADVAICARSESSLREVNASLREKGTKIYSAVCDAGEPVALKQFLDNARKALGGVDILVHNASALAMGPRVEDWEAGVKVDLMAAAHACEQVVPWMIEAGRGSILFVSSISGLEAFPTPDYGYTAVKAGLIAYAKKLALNLGPQGIRVNAIAPGSILFPGGIWESIHREMPDLFEKTLDSIPAHRFGTPEEVADVAVFLVSPRAKWVAGECVSIDGCQHRGVR